MPNTFQRTKWDIYPGVTLKFSDINYELQEKKIEVILQPLDGLCRLKHRKHVLLFITSLLFFNLNQYNRFAALFDGERQIAVLLS